MKYEDVACGFCGSLSIEQDLVQSSSQKFNDIVESLSKRGGSKKVLEVILEQREEESAHETSSVSNNNNPSSSSQCTDDEVELSIKSPTAKEQDKGEEVAMKTFIDTALTTPMFGIKSPQQAVTSPSNLASPKAPVSPGGSHPGFAFQEGIHKELDFDVNPSEVYLLLQRRDWNGAVQRLRTHPEEATYWISRREADGKLRWRLLPIHGAIIFCAPDTTVKSLIDAFPDSAQAKDDQGMLPLHLSYRMGSPAPVVEVLLHAFPESLTVKDRKGRTPVVMAQTAKGPNRAVFLRTIEKTQQQQKQQLHIQASPKAVTTPVAVQAPTVTTIKVDAPTSIQVPSLVSSPVAPRTPAVNTVELSAAAKSRAEYEAQIKHLQKEHQEQMEAVRKSGEKAREGLEEEVVALKADLAAAEEASQVLSEHVATLERRLKQEEETQTHLASKIAMLDSAVKSTMQEKNETEGKLTEERDSLQAKRHSLEASLEVFRTRNDELEKTLSELKVQWEKDYKELETKHMKQTKEQEELQKDYEGVSSNVRLLDNQLKKKMMHEQKLVKQVTELVRQLTEATEENENATNMFTKAIREIQKERDDLRLTVSGLSKKLVHVAGCLEEMSQKQNEIAAKALAQEKETVDATALHDQIMSEFKAQADLHDRTRREREQIAEVLRQQEAAFARGDDARAKVVETMNEYGAKVEQSQRTRQEITEETNAVKSQIEAVIKSVAATVPNGVKHGEELVDLVIQTVLSKKDEPEIELTESQIMASDDAFTLYVPKTPVAHGLDEIQGHKEEDSNDAERDVSVYQLHDEKKEDGTEEIEMGI